MMVMDDEVGSLWYSREYLVYVNMCGANNNKGHLMPTKKV